MADFGFTIEKGAMHAYYHDVMADPYDSHPPHCISCALLHCVVVSYGDGHCAGREGEGVHECDQRS